MMKSILFIFSTLKTRFYWISKTFIRRDYSTNLIISITNRSKCKISLKNKRTNLTYFIRFEYTMFFMFFLLKLFKKRFDKVITSFSIMINEKKHDEVKLILNNKVYRKRLQYFVKWLNWSNVENQWIYVDDVQIDELMKNFHQQYFQKLSENASNAKKKRIENN
jgi:hypothetical protein